MKPRTPKFVQSLCVRGGLRKVAKLPLLLPIFGLCMCGYGKDSNPPPLNNLEDYPSRGPITAPPSTFAKEGESEADIKEPDMRAYLQPIAPARLDARATLKQVGRDVLIAVHVSGGPPGKARVTVDRKSCDVVAKGAQAEAQGSGTAQAAPSIGVGELMVNESGLGELVTSIEGVTLSGDQGADSLVGKSLVVYQSEQRASPTDQRPGLPIACTKI